MTEADELSYAWGSTGTPLNEIAEGWLALKARIEELERGIQEQAIEVWSGDYQGAICLLCGGETEHFDDDRDNWTDEQWKEACPHDDDCIAQRWLNEDQEMEPRNSL